MDKRVSGGAALLILVAIVSGIFLFRGDGSEASSQQSNTPAAPTVVATTAATATAVASPVPGASPIAGVTDAGSDCTGIQGWTERVQARFAETDAIAAGIQDKDDLAALSVDELTKMVVLLQAGYTEQQADVPPSAGAETQQALLALIQIEIDFFQATLDAQNSGGDIGAVYDLYIGQMQTAAGGVSVLAMTLAFTCYDSFE